MSSLEERLEAVLIERMNQLLQGKHVVLPATAIVWCQASDAELRALAYRFTMHGNPDVTDHLMRRFPFLYTFIVSLPGYPDSERVYQTLLVIRTSSIRKLRVA